MLSECFTSAKISSLNTPWYSRDPGNATEYFRQSLKISEDQHFCFKSGEYYNLLCASKANLTKMYLEIYVQKERQNNNQLREILKNQTA